MILKLTIFNMRSINPIGIELCIKNMLYLHNQIPSTLIFLSFLLAKATGIVSVFIK